MNTQNCFQMLIWQEKCCLGAASKESLSRLSGDGLCLQSFQRAKFVDFVPGIRIKPFGIMTSSGPSNRSRM